MKIQYAFALVGTLTMAALACGGPPKKDPHLTIDLTRKDQDLLSTLRELDVPTIVDRCGPSVVVVVGTSKQGSGVVVSQRQMVATNAHVVEGETELRVRFREGSEVAAAVVLTDESVDLALLRLPPGDHPFVELGESDTLRAGEGVVAIGAPLGLEQTVSTGEIAALREFEGERIIQISVPISSGSSGGGLFDRRGKLIGITTASATRGQNLNFAMPSNSLKRLLAKVP